MGLLNFKSFNSKYPADSISLRNFLFFLFFGIGLTVFIRPLRELVFIFIEADLYAQNVLIPIFSIAIIFLKRRLIFSRIMFDPVVGSAVILAGLIMLHVGKVLQTKLVNYDYLLLYTSGFLLFNIGVFIAIYGRQAFKKAMFPWLFMFLALPLPSYVLERSIWLLQQMTADTVDAVYRFIGLTYLRDGIDFQLAEFTVQVAENCSGIKSCLALIILATAAGYVFLETGWRRLLLTLAIIPITIFKNALRITMLTLLAIHDNPGWLNDSWLHQYGGKPFFIIALMLWSPVLLLLLRSERKIIPEQVVISDLEEGRGP